MSKFRPLVDFKTEFEGDKVSMKLKPLKRRQLMILSPHMKGVEGKLDDMAILDVAADLIPEQVTEFKGLKDDAGNAVSVGTMSEEVYFLNLMTGILEELFVISSLKEKQVKNSPGRPDTLPLELGSSELEPLPESLAKNGLSASVHAATEQKGD